jgi:squalene-associated FAD-dependent desaturase
MSERPSVLIVGGGLAGLAAATALASRGLRVALVEARGRLGGRASSFTDTATGQLLDTCQHVSMGCCTNFAHFCRTVGISHLLEPQKRLYFMTPDRRTSIFSAGPWPAPFHLSLSFLGAHYLSPTEKLRVAWGLARLQHHNPDDDVPFQAWLESHRQTPRTIERFWGLVLTSALNETPERVGLRYARKVFVDGFLRHRRGFEVELPRVPLGRLYGEELARWLRIRQVTVQLNSAPRSVCFSGDSVDSLETRGGETLKADWYVAAVSFDRLLEMLPGDVVERHACFANLRKLETSPITSVHLWYRAPITELPHVVLVGCLGQWLFNRGMTAAGEQYVQVVVSAARRFRGLGNEEIQKQIGAELEKLFPAAVGGLLRSRVVTEHAATFSAVPGVDRWRPGQQTPIGNLFLAGDYTATGWPATMEGAVRSGYLAAEALLEKISRPARFVQADLR